jgi:predicted HicB family RNase H-like nuclease
MRSMLESLHDCHRPRRDGIEFSPFRSRASVKKAFLLRMDASIFKRLHTLAQYDGISVNSLIYQILRDYLKKRD